jgi:hypothetical protein
MAMTLSAPDMKWRGRVLEPRSISRFVIGTAIAASIVLSIYGFAIVPILQRHPKVKPIAEKIDRLVPNGETLYAIDPDYQPFLFYVRSHLIYASRVEDVPTSARYLLIQAEREQELVETRHWLPLQPQPIERFTDYRNHTVILARVVER